MASLLPLVECVPNFSEGRDLTIIRQITDAMESVEGVKLLDVDPGKATNRTVVTIVGHPEQVIEAAFRGIAKAAELIDMNKHQGEHPRMGATDVCPLIPIANITMEEAAAYAHRLAKRVGDELQISCFMYESAATSIKRRNLATIRAGEYEAMARKIQEAEWKPDYGPTTLHERAGVTAIGARDFLIAYNVNLNTTSVRRANSVAFDIREQGRVKREGDPVSGPVITGPDGEPERIPGTCKSVKGIGWYIEEYGLAQVSMNITNIRDTPLHRAFEACLESAHSRGMRVTGSELVGLVPKQVMLDAGRYFLHKQQRSTGLPDEEIIRIAVKSMGLDELGPFDIRKKIIEYQLEDANDSRLVRMDLRQFSAETASESPAPGGGSISAYVGALGAALGGMVANLSAHKRGWDDRWEEFSTWAEKAQAIQDRLLFLVDEDTRAFNGIMDAFGLPKNTPDEKAARSAAIQAATRHAIAIPLQVMEQASAALPVLKVMARDGNPNSASDAGVGALCARAAVQGAWLNVRINAGGFKDKVWLDTVLAQGQQLADDADQMEKEILEIVKGHM
ncbi:MAG: glutamate formimidoyltransferase [Saprospiraceae bacterium]|nr:glutamate formimidoyltransferase [Saprospiraceae bacterium]